MPAAVGLPGRTALLTASRFVRRYGKLRAMNTHRIELADGRGIECRALPGVAQTIPLDDALRVPTRSI